jgi:hypothetical protein
VSQRAQNIPRGQAASTRRWAVLGLVVVAVVPIIAIAACSSTPTVDRDQAVAKVLDDSHGQMSRDQATCYVGRVIDEVGVDQLQPDAHPTPSQVGKLTSIRIDCIGVANLGLPVPDTGTSLVTGPSETSAHRIPQRLGDDPQLDALYRACQQGNGQACDALFDAAGPGTDYEEFAVTCGSRTREKVCADVYGPGGSAPATAAGKR